MRITTASGATAVVAALFLAGCGSSGSTLDTAKLKERVTHNLEKRDFSGVQLTCPDKVDAKAGASLDCQLAATATSGLNGSPTPVTGKVTIKLQDDKGDQYSYKGNYSGGGLTGDLNGYSGK
jgi:hypothetical protein